MLLEVIQYVYASCDMLLFFLPLLRHFNPAEPVVEKSVIL